MGDHFSRLRLFEEEGRADKRMRAQMRVPGKVGGGGGLADARGRGHAVALTPSAELPSSVRVFAKSRMTRI